MSFKTCELTNTDFTKVIHQKPYERISVSRPELSQKGKTVLVTGGATNIGFGIATAFIKAGAKAIVIIGRRASVLEDAATELREAGSANIITVPCDQSDPEATKKLWAELTSRGILVDVLVLNAGDFIEEKPLLELSAERLWSAYETNVRGPLLMIDGLNEQRGGHPKFILNISTCAINMLHGTQSATSAARPAYGLTKNAGTMLISQIAKDANPDQLQLVSFHPGLIHSQEFLKMGISKTDLPFDDVDLPGSFAVWASTKEAAFLHGRFVWASWDIEEYSKGEIRRRIDEDPSFLTVGVAGLDGAFKNQRTL